MRSGDKRPDQLPAASPALLPIDNDAESKRAANVEQLFGNVAPGLVQNTTEVLFCRLAECSFPPHRS
jgi:hypothetical protein